MNPRRVVLLGASNLTTGLPLALAAARARLGAGPHTIHVAAGHGRSYGRWSRVAFRGLPAILDCGLWEACRRPPARWTHALITDIGNDLAYGAAPAELAGWVAECLERLAALEADTVVTLLPERSLAGLAPWQYRVFRTLLFPGCRLSLAAMQARVAEVNDRLVPLAASRGAVVVEPAVGWYGSDAIHVRRSHHPAVWRELLSRWRSAPEPTRQVSRPPACSRLRPEWRTILGVTLRRPQPSAVLDDGSTVSFY